MAIALSFESVSKLYRLGEVGTGSLAQDIQRAWAKLRGMPDPFMKIGQVNNREQPLRLQGAKASIAGANQHKSNGFFNRKVRESAAQSDSCNDGLVSDFVWALKDISFDVAQGDVVGILGRNGAGKSTLLKLLSRVTAPTEGFIRSKGRIASLLEVGTGFHPELTGRENIYLNGAILGMSRSQIAKQLDEIVEFSGCARYIDTPVKRYSSGMVVRLGFAVAAHLECEVLVVDEVLAVGDSEFQSKCIGKLRDVSSQSGKTVLFVSHNIGVVSQLCNTGLFLSSGRLICQGPIQEVTERYYEEASSGRVCKIEVNEDAIGHNKVTLRKAEIVDGNGRPSDQFSSNGVAVINVEFDVNEPGTSYCIAAELESVLSGVVFCTSTLDRRPSEELGSFGKIGRYIASFQVPLAILREGTYLVSITATVPCVEVLDKMSNQLSFYVNDNSSPIAILGEGRRGHVIQVLEWQVREKETQ